MKREIITPSRIDIVSKISHKIPDRKYVTHSFDKYPAKMVPHIARFMIEKYSQRDQKIIDPFCGCGTTLVEAVICGRHVTGVDVNPYASLLAEVKSKSYDITKSKKYLQAIDTEMRSDTNKAYIDLEPGNKWIEYWFVEHNLLQLIQLRRIIEATVKENKYKRLYLAILGVTTRKVSKADQRSPKPFISKRCYANRVNERYDVNKIFNEQSVKFLAMTKELKSLASHTPQSRVKVVCDDALSYIKRMRKNQFDLVITSPPYLSAQDYYRSSKLEIAITGIVPPEEMPNIGPKMIGSGRGNIARTKAFNKYKEWDGLSTLRKMNIRDGLVVSKYLNDFEGILKALYSVTKSNSKLCLVIGDSTIQGVNLPVHKWVIQLAVDCGYSLREHLVETVRNRRLAPKRKGHESVINNEHIIVFSK